MACCLPTCAQGFSLSGAELVEKCFFLGFFGFSVVPCASWGACFASHLPCMYKAWFSKMCLLLHALWAEYGWGIIFVTPGEFAGQHKKTASQNCGMLCGLYGLKLYVLVSVGRPNLHRYDACVVFWIQGASQRNRQKQCKTSSSPTKIFLFSRISTVRFLGSGSLVFYG